MSAVAYMVERIAHAEASRGISRSAVRTAVARRIGVARGTVENIERNRLKFVERVESKVRAAFIRLLETEIAKATHELEVARRLADRGDCPAVLNAEISLRSRVAEAQKILR